MSGTRRNRKLDPAQRRKAFTRGTAQPSRWQLAECCGATIAADQARMGSRWADVHEPGCRVPWDRLGLDGEPREVYPGAEYLPEGSRLRAVNRQSGSVPANPDHLAAQRRRA